MLSDGLLDLGIVAVVDVAVDILLVVLVFLILEGSGTVTLAKT